MEEIGPEVGFLGSETLMTYLMGKILNHQLFISFMSRIRF